MGYVNRMSEYVREKSWSEKWFPMVQIFSVCGTFFYIYIYVCEKIILIQFVFKCVTLWDVENYCCV